ncbi:hypothetical protein BV20DRAFT_554467 [Pilatotrama ljubarskyi]|nr:hypothetical protein BV20DRAFT_554467 [Pilatotrama ljubarskyi]
MPASIPALSRTAEASGGVDAGGGYPALRSPAALGGGAPVIGSASQCSLWSMLHVHTALKENFSTLLRLIVSSALAPLRICAASSALTAVREG